MNKLFARILCEFFAVALFCAPIKASAIDGAFGWYCTKGRNGLPPPEFEFIKNYGGYSVDYRYVGNESDKVIYLTFDVGYENGNVGKILDILAEEKVTGAFFVLENVAKRNPELLIEMKDSGHTICNHTASHKDMSCVNGIEEFKDELERLEKACKDSCGVEVSKYYRPPEGRFSEESLKIANKLGYKTIFWSFAYADWDNNKQMSPEKAKEKLMNGTHNGMVLLLHPTSATNAAILREMISWWRSEGYRFGTLDELTA